MFRFGKKDPQPAFDPSRVPRHIGIIMDGNGRWAKRRGLPRSAGHRAGIKVLEDIVEYADSLGIEMITAYAFSTENWKRSKDEVDALMALLLDYLRNFDKHLGGRNVRVRVIGERSALSEEMQAEIARAEEGSGKNTGITVNLAINYGGRLEIVQAVQKLAERVRAGELDPADITEDTLSDEMYLGPAPPLDFIIRPSGELRLSNFMLWDSAYAEFWFDNICWPDFRDKDLLRAVVAYQNRDRRFGNAQ